MKLGYCIGDQSGIRYRVPYSMYRYQSNKQKLSTILGIVRATGGGDSIIHGGNSDWGTKAAKINLPSKFNSNHFKLIRLSLQRSLSKHYGSTYK
jgi:hypothetical protein